MSKYAEYGSKEWWKFVDKHWEKILSIIQSYHPSYRRNYSKKITAKRAEAYRQDVVSEIEAEGKVDPEKAYKDRDADTLFSIMQSTWFGVPESTDCWSIEGFSEMVAILEEGIEILL